MREGKKLIKEEKEGKKMWMRKHEEDYLREKSERNSLEGTRIDKMTKIENNKKG